MNKHTKHGGWTESNGCENKHGMEITSLNRLRVVTVTKIKNKCTFLGKLTPQWLLRIGIALQWVSKKSVHGTVPQDWKKRSL
jgi:hypothetical protein